MVSNNPELSQRPVSFLAERENISRASAAIREVGDAFKEFHRLMRSVHDRDCLKREDHSRTNLDAQACGATLAELQGTEQKLLRECCELLSQKVAFQRKERFFAAALTCSRDSFSTQGSGKEFAKRAVDLCRLPHDVKACHNSINLKLEEIGLLQPLLKSRFLIERGHHTEQLFNQSLRRALDDVAHARGALGLRGLFAPAALRAAQERVEKFRTEEKMYRALDSHSLQDDIRRHPAFSIELHLDNETQVRRSLIAISSSLVGELRSSLEQISPAHIAERITNQDSPPGSPSSSAILRSMLKERLMATPTYGRLHDNEDCRTAAIALLDDIVAQPVMAEPRHGNNSSPSQCDVEDFFARCVGSNPRQCLHASSQALHRIALGDCLAPAADSLRTLLSAGINELPYDTRHEVQALISSIPALPPDNTPPLYHDLLGDPGVISLAEAAFRGLDGTTINLSPASLSRVRLEIADSALSIILVSREHQEKTIQLGYTFAKYCDPARHAPFLLLNSLREPGFSGECPFISSSSPAEPSILVKALLSIPDERVEAMRDFPCPSLYSAVSLLREHGQDVFRSYDNPLNEPFWRHVEQLALHYIKHGSPSELQFGVSVLGQVRVELGTETIMALRDLVDKDSPEALDRELLRLLETRKFYSSRWPAELCLRLMEKVAIPQSKWSRWQDADAALEKLFWILQPETIGDPGIRARLARCFSLSGEEMARSLDALDWLSKNGLLHSKELKGSNRSGDDSPDIFKVSRCWRILEWEHVARFGRVANLAETLERHTFTAARTREEALSLSGIIVEAILLSEREEPFTAGSFDDVCRTITKLCDAQRRAGMLDTDGSGSANWLESMAKIIADVARQGRSLTPISEALDKALGPLSSAAQAARALPHDRYDPALLFSEKSLPTLLNLFPDGQDHSGLLQSGIPLLARAGWLTEEGLPVLAEMLPAFAKEGASSLDAWQSHAANIGHGKADFLDSEDFSFRGELRSMLEFQRHFYALPAPTLYRAFRAIGHPERAQDLQEFGLKHIDTRVISELKLRIAGIREQLLTSEAAIPIESELDEELLSAFIGYGAGPYDMSAATKKFNSSASEGRVKPLEPGFFDKAFTVDCLDAERIRAFSFSEPTANRYKLFVGDLQAVRGKTLSEVVDSEHKLASKMLSSERDAIARALASGAEMTSAQRSGRERELARIEGILTKLDEDSSILGLMGGLSEFRQKENPVSSPSLRRISLRLGLDELSDEAPLFGLLSSAPSKEALESIVALVNTNLKNEALAQPAFRKVTQQQLASIQASVGTLPFQEDLKKLNSIGTAGSEKILVHPTRGLLGELSGYNCSACWAREQDIMARYPNATALMFVRNADNESRKRVVGACILLKVKDTAGNNTFVIRGLNPTQNFITALKPDSFFERFIDDVVVPYAQAQGVTKIVIPNEAVSGGAQTNRPSLAAYIRPTYRDCELVRLDTTGPNSSFNGYQIADGCVLVRDVASGLGRAENG